MIKRHSGLESDQPNPKQQGFDHWFSCDNNLIKHNPEKLIRNGEPVGKTESWAAQVVADEANDWIKNRRARFLPTLLSVRRIHRSMHRRSCGRNISPKVKTRNVPLSGE